MSNQKIKMEYEFSAKDNGVTRSLAQLSQYLDSTGSKATVVAKRMTENGEKIERFSSRINKSGGQLVNFTANLQRIDNSLFDNRQSIDKSISSFEKMKKSNRDIGNSIDSLRTKYEQIKKTKEVDIKTSQQMEAEVSKLQNQLNKHKQTYEDAGRQIEKLNQKKKNLTAEITKAEMLYGKENEKVVALKNSYNQLEKDIKKLETARRREGESIQANQKALDNFTRTAIPRIKQYAQANEEALKKQKELSQTQKALAQAEKSLSNDLAKTNKELENKSNKAKKVANAINDYKYKTDSLVASFKAEQQAGNISVKTITAYENKLRSCAKTTTGFKREIDSLKASQQNILQTINQKTQALLKLEKEMKSNDMEATALRNDIKALETAYDALDDDIKTAEKAFEAMNQDIANFSREVSKAKSEMNIKDKLTALGDAGISAGKSIQNLGNNIKSAGQMVSGFGDKITALGDKLSFLTTIAGGIFGGAIAQGVSYEKSMTELIATLDKANMSSGEFSSTVSKLENKIRTLALDSPFSLVELTDGMKYLSLAGYDVEAMLNSLEYTMIASQITGQDLASTTNLVTDAMSAFHLKAQDMPKFLDVMAKLQAVSNTSMSQVTDAFIWAGGTLADLNITLEESGALFGALANQGMKSALAGRSLVSILGNITDESSTAGKALQELEKKTGIKVTPFDENNQYMGVDKQIKNLKKALEQVSEKERIQLSYDIAGKNQKKTLDKLLHGVEEDFDKIKEKLENSDGTLIEMKATVDESAWSKIKKMVSAMQEAFKQVWDVIRPFVVFAVEKITELAGKFAKLTGSQKENIVKWLVLIGLLPLAIKLIGSFFKIIGGGIMVFGSLINIIGGFLVFVSTGFNVLVSLGGVVVSVISAVFSALWNVGSFIIGTLIPYLVTTSVTIAGLTLPLWLVIGVIGIVGATIFWLCDAFKRGFDENNSVLENFVNMFQNVGKDFQHWCLGLVENFSVSIAKMAGVSEETINKVRKFFDSDHDNEAQAEGYKDYEDKKAQQKQAKKEEKSQAREQKKQELVSNLKESIGDIGGGLLDGADGLLGSLGTGLDGLVGNLGEKIKGVLSESDLKMFEDLGIDFDIEGGLGNLIEEFKEFQAEDKKVKIETEIDELAFEKFSELEEYDNAIYEAKLDIAVEDGKIREIDEQILDLMAQKRELEIEGKIETEEYAKVESDLDKLFADRKVHLDVIEKNKGVIEENESKIEELDGKEAQLAIKAQEAGMTIEEYKAKLKKEELTLELGYEIVHENAEEQITLFNKQLSSVESEKLSIEAQLKNPDLTVEEAQNLITRLQEVTDEENLIKLAIDYTNYTEDLQTAQSEYDGFKKQLEEVNINLKPFEGLELDEIKDPNIRKAVEGWRTEQENLNVQLADSETKINSAKDALGEMGETADLEGVVQYIKDVNGAIEKYNELTKDMPKFGEGDSIIQNNTVPELTRLKELNDYIDKLDKKEINIETGNTQANVDNVNTKLDTTKTNIDDAKSSMEQLNSKAGEFSSAFDGVNTSGLTESVNTVSTKMGDAREKLISFNNIANSSTRASLQNAGDGLFEALTKAREKLSHIAGYCNNTGKTSMTGMGNALTNSVSGAREKLSHVAGYARNTGSSALSAMGNALLSKLSSSYNMVKSIASMANSIKISTPSPSSFSSGGSGGGSSRSWSMPQAITTTLELPSMSSMGDMFKTSTNNTSTYNNTANVNMYMSDINSNSRTSANNFYRQLKKKCQRDGLFD